MGFCYGQYHLRSALPNNAINTDNPACPAFCYCKKEVQKGIPYQALISGLIHQYVEGELLEK